MTVLPTGLEATLNHPDVDTIRYTKLDNSVYAVPAQGKLRSFGGWSLTPDQWAAVRRIWHRLKFVEVLQS